MEQDHIGLKHLHRATDDITEPNAAQRRCTKRSTMNLIIRLFKYWNSTLVSCYCGVLLLLTHCIGTAPSALRFIRSAHETSPRTVPDIFSMWHGTWNTSNCLRCTKTLWCFSTLELILKWAGSLEVPLKRKKQPFPHATKRLKVENPRFSIQS